MGAEEETQLPARQTVENIHVKRKAGALSRAADLERLTDET